MTIYLRLLQFLQDELAIPPTAIATGERLWNSQAQQFDARSISYLPIVLWQYGLVSLEQLDQIFDWLETV